MKANLGNSPHHNRSAVIRTEMQKTLLLLLITKALRKNTLLYQIQMKANLGKSPHRKRPSRVIQAQKQKKTLLLLLLITTTLRKKTLPNQIQMKANLGKLPHRN
ncbi:uncharacterized protein [Amphiura filiformis]|uniref:uncharacterized protein n=1 Tax=Amphiura filiformis TaxID=82378 RepID=UPI003B210A5F